MNIQSLTGWIAPVAHRVGAVLRRNSPTILLTGGVIGVVTSTVLACRATYQKLGDVVAETTSVVDEISLSVPEERAHKELKRAYFRAGVKIAKIYLPSAALGALSLVGIISSHNIMRGRNAALTAAYASLSGAFAGYRGRVADRFGEEVEQEIRYNITKETITRTETDKDGNTRSVEEQVDVVDIDETRDTARFFGKTHRAWSDQPDYYNTMLIKHAVMTANQQFFAKGMAVLNDVYPLLGFKPSARGFVEGWVRNSDSEPMNFIHISTREVRRRAADGSLEEGLLLEFNTEGNIIARAKEKGLITN